jgi:hypothetical protein
MTGYYIHSLRKKNEGEIEKRALHINKVQIYWLYLTVVFPLTFTIVR